MGVSKRNDTPIFVVRWTIERKYFGFTLYYARLFVTLYPILLITTQRHESKRTQ